MGSSIKDFWHRKNVWQVIFILIIVYAVSSINILVLGLSVLEYLHGAFFNDSALAYFAEISFLVAAFLCVYHITTMFGKSKIIKMDEED